MSETDLSTDGYIFLDVDRPHIAWATYRGTLITPPSVENDTGRFVSWWQAELHRYSSHLKREAALEQVRTQKFPEKISRLNGLFCFLDKESAAMASRLWGNHFKSENLAEVNLDEAKGRERLDSNWITYSDSETTMPSDGWISYYWQGKPYPDEEPIWETLVEGKVTVLGVDLRTRAYQIVKEHWPDSLMFLEITRLGAWIGSDIGSINAFMTEDTGNYFFKFFMDMRNADNPEFLAQLKHLIESGHPVNEADMKPHYTKGNFGSTPDMRSFQFSCPKDINLTLDKR